MCAFSTLFRTVSLSTVHYVVSSNEEDLTAVTDSNGNTLRIRRDTNRMPVRVVAPDNQVRCHDTTFVKEPLVVFWFPLVAKSATVNSIQIK